VSLRLQKPGMPPAAGNLLALQVKRCGLLASQAGMGRPASLEHATVAALHRPSLPAPQGNCKRDAEGYAEEFQLQYRHYKALLQVFSLTPSKEAKEFGDLVSFISQVRATLTAIHRMAPSGTSLSRASLVRGHVFHSNAGPPVHRTSSGHAGKCVCCAYACPSIASVELLDCRRLPFVEEALHDLPATDRQVRSVESVRPSSVPSGRQVAASYPQQTEGFAGEVAALLDTHGDILDGSLRLALVKALILLRNRNQASRSARPRARQSTYPSVHVSA
jgi:NUC130/3NT domain